MSNDPLSVLNAIGGVKDTGSAPLRPSIPAVPTTIDPALGSFLSSIKQTIEGWRGLTGDKIDAAVTWRDLSDTNLVTVAPDVVTGISGTAGATGQDTGSGLPWLYRVIPKLPDGMNDFTPPIAPTGLRTSNGKLIVIVQWNSFGFSNPSYTEIWASLDDDITTAYMVGTSASLMFTHTVSAGVTMFYWARFVSKALVQGPFNAVDGVPGTALTLDGTDIGGAAAIPKVSELPVSGMVLGDVVLLLTDSKLYRYSSAGWTSAVAGSDIQAMSITADKISVASLSAVSTNTGTLTAGDGSVVIDGSGSIQVYAGDNSVLNRDYAFLTNGQLKFMRYRDGAYHEYKAVKRVNAGVALSGSTVTLPGWYDTQPSVQVSINAVQSYSTAYSAQNQSWNCRADNLRESFAGSKVWKFDAIAELSLTANSGTTTSNSTSGTISVNGSYWDSAQTSLFANTASITVNVNVYSVRGTGTNTNLWAYRKVLWQVWGYKSSVWTLLGSKTTAIGAQTVSAVADSLSISGITNTTKYFVRFYPQDAGGTFSLGADTYDYLQETRSSAVTVTATASLPNTSNTSYLTLPGHTPQAGYVVYSVTYNYSLSYTIGLKAPDWWAGSVTYPTFYAASFDSGAINAPSFSSGSYDPNAIYVTARFPYRPESIFASETIGNIHGGSATIYSKKIQANSTSSVDVFTLVSNSWTVTGYVALATGALNWVAVGE